MSGEQPLISCLCVTEGRAAFMPWLLWSFSRQSWRHKELVIIDSSPFPCPIEDPRVRVLRAPPGSNIPNKRNVALQAARGQYLAWFDDDDWQHPERLAEIADRLAAGAAVAGTSRSFFVDLFTLGSYHYVGRGHVIFNAAGFVAEVARAVRFDERLTKASDTSWMDAVLRAAAGRVSRIDGPVHSFWLCHDGNVSNPRTQLPLCFPIALVKARIGATAWGETDCQLQSLASRVRAEKPATWQSRQGSP
jgi:hypothetical protein